MTSTFITRLSTDTLCFRLSILRENANHKPGFSTAKHHRRGRSVSENGLIPRSRFGLCKVLWEWRERGRLNPSPTLRALQGSVGMASGELIHFTARPRYM